MAQPVDDDTAGPRVCRSQKRFQRIVTANDERGSPKHFEVLGNEAHPHLFAAGDQYDSCEKDGSVAIEAQETARAAYIQWCYLCDSSILT